VAKIKNALDLRWKIEGV